jgi:hypothetical protein
VSDERTFEQQAYEYAKWLASCIAYTVGATRECLGLATPWLPDLKDALFHATRAAFLRGAYGTALRTCPFSKSELNTLSIVQGHAAAEWAWNQVVATARETGRYTVTAETVGTLREILGPLVRENCAEIFLHGANHARRKARQALLEAQRRFHHELLRGKLEALEDQRPRQFTRILGHSQEAEEA